MSSIVWHIMLITRPTIDTCNDTETPWINIPESDHVDINLNQIDDNFSFLQTSFEMQVNVDNDSEIAFSTSIHSRPRVKFLKKRAISLLDLDATSGDEDNDDFLENENMMMMHRMEQNRTKMAPLPESPDYASTTTTALQDFEAGVVRSLGGVGNTFDVPVVSLKSFQEKRRASFNENYHPYTGLQVLRETASNQAARRRNTVPIPDMFKQ